MANLNFRMRLREHGLQSSQRRFKPSTLGLTTLASGPEARVKACNCAMLSLLIAACCKKLSDMHLDDAAKELAMTSSGFAMLWEIYHLPCLLTDTYYAQAGGLRKNELL